MEQSVDTPTRVVITGEAISTSSLDYVYLSYCKPQVMPVGDSDHWGHVVSQQFTKLPNQPLTKKVRVFNKFDTFGFCLDLIQAEVKGLVPDEASLNMAHANYHRELLYTAEKWASLKTTQIRKKKGPTWSLDTKLLIATRDGYASNPHHTL